MTLFTAKKLTALRKYNGLSQEALAEKIGVSRQAISKWERGEASPDTENLIALSKIYGVSLDDLLGDKTAEEIIAEKNEEKPCDDNTVPETAPEKPAVKTPENVVDVIKRETADLPALGRKMLRFPFFLIAIIGYLAVGFALKLWHPTWLIFIVLPAYYLCALSFIQKTKKKMLLLQPVYLYAVILFLLVGLLLNIWHPTWIIFICIPAYYWYVGFRK